MAEAKTKPTAASVAAFGVSVLAREALLDVAIGLGLVIAGVGDHRLLQKALQRPTEA